MARTVRNRPERKVSQRGTTYVYKRRKPDWKINKYSFNAKLYGTTPKKHYYIPKIYANISDVIRKHDTYRNWKNDILNRDNRTCQQCNSKDRPEVHHIKPFSLILKQNKIDTIVKALNCPELWNRQNGITLCHDCHKLTDSYMKSMDKIEQLEKRKARYNKDGIELIRANVIE